MKLALVPVLICIILTVSGSLPSQTYELNLENINNRFPELSGVAQILQDNRGFMWFGSGSGYGLLKFDGYEVMVYKNKPEDSTSLSSSSITAIVEDKQMILWIGTINGLNRLNPINGSCRRYNHNPNDPRSISNNYLTALYIDNSGIMWIGTQEGGLNKTVINQQNTRDSLYFYSYRYDSANANSLSNNYVRFIIEDTLADKSILWIGTANGLNLFDKISCTFTRYFHDPNEANSLINNDLHSVYRDKQGDLWFGASEGWLSRLHKTKTGALQFSHHRLGANLKIYSITANKDDNLWLSTNFHGLYHFNTKSYRTMHHNSAFSGFKYTDLKSVSTTFIDNAGTLWIGTWPYLYKNDPHRRPFDFVPVSPPPRVWSMDVLSFYEDNERILWVGTGGRGILKYDIRRNQFYNFAPDSITNRYLSSPHVQTILEDKNGTIWVATLKGLNRYERSNDRFYSYYWDPTKPDNPDHLISNYLHCLYEDQQSNLWIGSPRGLTRMDSKRTHFAHYLTQSDQINRLGHYIGAIHEDRQGRLLIGARGLFQFNPANGKLSRYYHIPTDSTSTIDTLILRISEDSNGNIWIGALDGLYRLSPNQPLVHYTEKHGLPNNFIKAIIEDEQGQIWIGTHTKLARYIKDTDRFRAFDDMREVFCSCYKGKDGRLYFGRPNGFLMFHPAAIQDNTFIPPVHITGIKIFDQPITFTEPVIDLDEIRFNHQQNFLTFDFIALNYTESEKNQYAYFLEGIDPDWVYSGSRRTTSYTNIPPGEYIFSVKASNNDGVWNEQGTAVHITITPPWWKTNLAYLIYIFLIIATAYGTWRFQMNRLKMKHTLEIEQLNASKLKEVDRMKSRFFANISHEFRTPLTLILGPVNSLLAGIRDHESRTHLTIMKRSALRLQQLINQLLDLSKLDAGRLKLQACKQDLVSLVRNFVQSFESLARLKGIELRFHCDQERIIAYADREKIETVINNLLSNAFKFTGDGGEIVVNLGLEQPPLSPFTKGEMMMSPPLSRGDAGGCIKITITDTGIGIPAERLDKIFDRFYQVDSSQKREFEGTGIGLALTRELVELHHGKISVESEVDKGTTFSILLPLGKEHLNQDEIVAESEVKEAAAKDAAEVITDEDVFIETLHEDSGLKTTSVKSLPMVLIVEDNSDMRVYMQGFLEDYYCILQARDGQEGFETALHSIPDLIISDVMMPQMDGFELCAKLKKDERTSHIPIILLTARAATEDKIGGLETGADDYLIKPFDNRELQVRVKNLIEQRRRLRERFLRESTLALNQLATGTVDEKFLQRLCEIILTKLSNVDFTLENLAQEIGMSRMTLHRKILGLSGQTPGNFIRTIRLKRGAELLKNKEVNISEIAYEVGFESPANFSRNFRRQFGMSPSEYCKQLH